MGPFDEYTTNINNNKKKDFISRGHSFDTSIFHEGLNQ